MGGGASKSTKPQNSKDAPQSTDSAEKKADTEAKAVPNDSSSINKDPNCLNDNNSVTSGNVSSDRLRRAAFGNSGYMDQQRDYDPTLSNVQLNKSQHIEWQSKGVDGKEKTSIPRVANSGNISINTNHIPSNRQPPPRNPNVGSMPTNIPGSGTPRGLHPGGLGATTGGRGNGPGVGMGAPGGGRIGPRPPPPRPPPGRPVPRPFVNGVNNGGMNGVVMAPSELAPPTAAMEAIPTNYDEYYSNSNGNNNNGSAMNEHNYEYKDGMNAPQHNGMVNNDDDDIIHGRQNLAKIRSKLDNNSRDQDESDDSDMEYGDDEDAKGVYDWFAYDTAQSLALPSTATSNSNANNQSNRDRDRVPPPAQTITPIKDSREAVSTVITSASPVNPFPSSRGVGSENIDTDSSPGGIFYATFADASTLHPTSSASPVRPRPDNIPALNMAQLHSPVNSSSIRAAGPRPRPPGGPPMKPQTANNLSPQNIQGQKFMQTSIGTATKTNGTMMSSTTAATSVVGLGVNTSISLSPRASTSGGNGGVTRGGPGALRPSAPPPKPSVSSPHAVKETKDVKRNVAQLPSHLSHAKPTTGNWLNKRYIVNNFILLDSLGNGSYGEVRLCKDRTSDQLFAMKIISKDLLKKRKNAKSSETYWEDIKREIAIMKKLLHPNVLRLYEVLDDPKVNKLYLVLEYMKKGDLMNFLKEKENISASTSIDDSNNNNNNAGNKKAPITPLSDLELWNIFRQVVSGIRYLHYQNVIHGDIKPQNLLVGEDGIVKIADFGISKMIQASGQKLADASGTPAFMSPELCAGEVFSGQLADVWALGATMFMLRFGNPPFVAKSIINLYNKIQNDPVVYPMAIDPKLRDLLDGMLTKDPNRRISLQQVMMHPWMKSPPLAITNPTESISLTSSKLREDNIHNKDSTSVNVNGNTIAAAAAATSNNRSNGNDGRFRPPPSYDLEEREAMEGPVNTVNNDELFRSISVGVHKRSVTNNTTTIGTGVDSSLESEAGSLFLGPGSLTTENNENDMENENILSTNWGDDVFEIVEEEENNYRSDSDDDDECYSDEKLDRRASSKNEDKQYGMEQPEKHDMMSAEEEERRTKSFQVQLSKKSLQSKGSSITTGTYCFPHPNHLNSVTSNESISPVRYDSVNSRQLSTNSNGNVVNLSTNSLTSNSSHRYGRTSTNTSEPNSLRASLSNGDLDDTADALSMEDFEQMMDTLAMQPIQPLKEEEDEDPIVSSEYLRLENLSTYWKNSLSGLGAAVHSEMGRRDTQEDRCVLLVNLEMEAIIEALNNRGPPVTEAILEQLRKISLAAIFDGHNGSRSSDFLAREFPLALVMHEKFLSKSVEEVFVDVCRDLDEKLCQMLKMEQDMSGSTALIALYDGRRHVLSVANVGDSCCVVSRGGKAAPILRVHRLNDEKERNRVEQAGGTVINNRVNSLLAVSRAFGDMSFKDCLPSNASTSTPSTSSSTSAASAAATSAKSCLSIRYATSPVISTPDVQSEVITPRTEFAILASDGLWDILSPQVAVNFVKKRLVGSQRNGFYSNAAQGVCDLQAIAKDLAAEAVSRGSIDNVSVIILSFHRPSNEREKKELG